MENDYILRQIRAISEGIAKILKKDISIETLGEVQKEDGSRISRMDAILECMSVNKVEEAVMLVNQLKYKISAYEFQGVVQWFMKLLKEYHTYNSEKITLKDIRDYEYQLNNLL